jgi:predicted dithiol-disulfide oxidoreductase (DUF899 family)
MDALAAQRRQLPWVRVEKNYRFETRTGPAGLGDLFGACSQLFVYHFMFGPDWEEACPTCSLVADNLNANLVHLAQRDVTALIISRAPLGKLEAFRKRMGWNFNWVSSHGSDFNFDYGVSFTPEQMAAGKFYNFGTAEFPNEEAGGVSVFRKTESGEVFHTYSCFGRGSESLLGVYNYLDLVPKGRNEDGLPWPTAWLRYHDSYDVA